MSMMDPNLLDAQAFGGPQSPLDIKPEASLLTTVGGAGGMLQSPGSASTSLMGFPGGGPAGRGSGGSILGPAPVGGGM